MISNTDENKLDHMQAPSVVDGLFQLVDLRFIRLGLSFHILYVYFRKIHSEIP